MDAATSPGSSGAPVIRADGAVVGLVDAGPNPNGPHAADAGQRLAVSSATARSRIQGWTAEPQPQPAVDCTGAVDSDGNPVPGLRRRRGQHLRPGRPLPVGPLPGGSQLVVWVTFTSHQSPGPRSRAAARPKETCTDWSLDYVMAPKNGLWLIDSTAAHEGAGNPPCGETASGTPTTAPASPSD